MHDISATRSVSTSVSKSGVILTTSAYFHLVAMVSGWCDNVGFFSPFLGHVTVIVACLTEAEKQFQQCRIYLFILSWIRKEQGNIYINIR